jgi:RNA polymerase II subunit A C-terminal domain phosphatase
LKETEEKPAEKSSNEESLDSKSASEESPESSKEAPEEKKLEEKAAVEKSPEEETVTIEKTDEKDEIEIEDPDDYLMYLEEILKRIHSAYYKEYEETGNVPVMRDVIPKIRRKVLEGQCIVFSGVVPTHLSVNNSRYAQLARKLGATVAEQVIIFIKSTSSYFILLQLRLILL